MALSLDDIRKIADLAKLELAESDLQDYADELSNILAFVGQIDAVDTADVVPMAHPLDAVQRLRTDTVTEADQRDLFQSNAPAVEDGLYVVPRVIE